MQLFVLGAEAERVKLPALSGCIYGICLHYISEYNTTRGSGYSVLVSKLNAIRGEAYNSIEMTQSHQAWDGSEDSDVEDRRRPCI